MGAMHDYVDFRCAPVFHAPGQNIRTRLRYLRSKGQAQVRRFFMNRERRLLYYLFNQPFQAALPEAVLLLP
jgi:hypothetical protein